LQIITVQDRRWEIYKRGVDFIQKYIFPGGMLIAPKVLRGRGRACGAGGRWIPSSSARATARRCGAGTRPSTTRWDEVAKLGFDDRFRRMWDFYLCSCAAAFRFGVTDVTQITVRKPA
jgi:cyclopropane-fatty-acyl-phospholipid synthase